MIVMYILRTREQDALYVLKIVSQQLLDYAELICHHVVVVVSHHANYNILYGSCITVV